MVEPIVNKMKLIVLPKKVLGSCLPVLCLFLARPSSCYSVTSPTVVKGSAAKPYEKKKVAVFGAGGYLGACMFGFLQRAGSLYGTGIAGIGAPRSITATAVGSSNLNGVLGKNFILAQADESFVKLTDMSSLDSIRSRVSGFDAVILATRYTLETRPVTGGSYDRTPNDKTLEFYMDRPRSSTVTGMDDPEYCLEMFKRSLEACREGGVKRIVVIETDSQFDAATPKGIEYIDLLQKSGVPYLYVQPIGTLENFRDYTYAKGVQGTLEVEAVAPSRLGSVVPGANPLYREDLAAFCVQSILSLDWSKNQIVRVKCTGTVAPFEPTKKVDREWCVKSEILGSLLSTLAQ